MAAPTVDLSAEIIPLPPGFDRWQEMFDLILRAFTYMDGLIDPPSSAYRLTAQSLAQKCAEETAFIAILDGRLAGCIFLSETDDHAYVGKLAVEPDLQGLGIGRRLMAAAEAEARRRGHNVIELQTRIELTGNHTAFARLGFRETAHGACRVRPANLDHHAQGPRHLTLALTDVERAIASGAQGEGAAMAMRIVAKAARLLGAKRLIPIASAHIDGALYHGDSGTLFAEKLVAGGAKAAVRATLNVGALDLTGCSQVRLATHQHGMARRMMDAYRAMGCETSWTCAPYQAGHRPAFGTDVAWGESNAVVFCNSVLGARTNRYGDFLDIACAISGRAPDTGLHRTENRNSTLTIDCGAIDRSFLKEEIAWPALGSLYGRLAGDAVGIVSGIGFDPGEDNLKAFGAAAASSGAVGLFHMEGVTPEAREGIADEAEPAETIRVTMEMVADAQRRLSTDETPGRIDAIAIGSPHLSPGEFARLERHLAGRKLAVPFYACTGRHVLSALEQDGRREALEAAGVTIVADTCVVVTPIMREVRGGVLMTNSGKFAHYAPGNTGYHVLFASLADCVESAVAGRPVIGGMS